MAIADYQQTNNANADPMQSLHDWAMELLSDGQAIRRAHEAQWWENIATYSGDIWTEYDVHTRKLQERAKPNHRVRLTINLAQPVVRTEYAKLIKNRPIVDVLARSDEKSDIDSAAVGDKVLNNYVEKHFHMSKVRRSTLMWVLICGFAGIFVDYDRTLLGESKVYVDAEGNPILDPRVIEQLKQQYADLEEDPPVQNIAQGDLVFKVASPFQLVWDFSQLDIHDASWGIFSDVLDCDEVYRRWGKEIEGSSNVEPGVLEKRLLMKADLTQKLELKKVSSQKLAQVNRLFIKPGHRKFPKGLEFVYTDQEAIYASVFPFQHGELPFSTMGHVPFPVSRYSLSVLQQVRGPVLEISKTESQLIENRNLMANPPWIEYTQHRLPDEIENKPGMRLKIDYVPGLADPHPVEMPEMPAYVQNLIETLKEHVLEISGQGETSQGKVPAGARSGVAIAYLQEEDDTKLGPTVLEYEEMIERVAGQTLSVIAQKYDAPRTIRIYKRHSDPEVFDFMGNMLAGVDGVEVQAGSALPRSKAAKQQFILDLWDRKLEQDPRRVREMLELSEGDPEEWEVDINQAERENSRLEQGEQQPVEDWYNHQAHHYIHRRYMKSADFEELDEGAQNAFREHDAMHTREEMDQQRQQMEEQAMASQAPATTPQGSAMQAPPAGGPANGMNNPGPQAPFASPGGLSALTNPQPQ